VIGCCGAITGKSGLLNVYFIVVLIVVILEIVVIILGVVKKKDFVEYTEKYAKELFDKYKGKYVTKPAVGTLTDTEALAVNTAQFVFSCCGLVNGTTWWTTAGTKPTDVPPGCCSNWDGKNVDYAKGMVDAGCGDGTVYEQGCTERLESLASEFQTVIIIVIVVVIVFEIICLAAACYSKKNDMVA